jgi:hypothetical protein
MMATDFVLSDRPSPTDLLVAACPFLEHHRTEYWECGDTIVFGDVARLLQNEQLLGNEAERVFKFFNDLAETGDREAVDVLATGALEKFNDDARSQRMARRNLHGRALEILEEMRVCWGQPDYDGPEES